MRSVEVRRTAFGEGCARVDRRATQLVRILLRSRGKGPTPAPKCRALVASSPDTVARRCPALRKAQDFITTVTTDGAQESPSCNDWVGLALSAAAGPWDEKTRNLGSGAD
jgi:hypothetical protein